MVVVFQIVFVSAVFCGALHAAPTVTYDQRQQGEFNLQVDVDDVAIILLPSDELAQRAILQSNKVQQIFGRHNGVKSKKKHHKKPVNCTMATVSPEVPYSSELPPTNVPTSSQGYEELYSTSSSNQDKLKDVVPVAAAAPVFEQVNVPADIDDQKIIVNRDRNPEDITPNVALQNTFEKNVDLTETAVDGVAIDSSEMLAVKTVEKPVTVVEPNNVTEMNAMQTVEKSADATTSQAPEIVNGSKTDVKTVEILSTNFEEKPVSISSYVKTVEQITNDETIKVNETSEKNANTEGKSNEITTVKIVEAVEIGEVKPAEMIVIKTIEKPTNIVIHEELIDKSAVDASRVNVLDMQVNTKTTNEPTEMIAMKTVEKPTFSEVLKVVKKPMEATDVVKAAYTTTTVDLSKSPTGMVAMKTMETPQTTGGPTDTLEKSGIITSTKSVEIQEDTKKHDVPSVENIVSRSAPKHTEMVAVKTVENSTTVKNVISVKTVVKPGIQKSTLSSNSSLIMRKVGDRKPLPTITLEVATPKVL